MTKELDCVVEEYVRRFGERPMGVARAPGRVNIIGEHIDYNDGWVLPAALELSVYLAFGPLAQPRMEMTSLTMDRTDGVPLPDPQKTPEEQAPAYPAWLRYGAGVAWALSRRNLPVSGMRGVVCSSVPVGSGLSSSAAIEAAFAIAWQRLGGWTLSRMEMAKACQQAEHTFAGVRCGLMDQFASLHGESGCALLLDCRSLNWQKIPMPAGAELVIANTRSAHKLESSAYNERRSQCEEAVRILARQFPDVRSLRDATPQMLAQAAQNMPEIIRRRAEHVVGECVRTVEAAEALRHGDLALAGRLMNASHDSLRDLYGVSGPELDAMVAAARSLPGCYGSRLTGGGFGGCTVQLVDHSGAQEFAAALAKKYSEKTGLEPEMIISKPSIGAEIL
jgi:galactokinase